MPTVVTSTRRHLSGWWAPLVVSGAVVGLDVASGPGIQYGGVFSAVPLLAASLAGPLLTAVQGVLAAAVCFGLGLVEATRQSVDGEDAATQAEHQLVRVAIILVITVIAVLVSHHRVVRERRARQVAAVADAAQQAILGPLPPVVGGLECASVYLSATSQARIGGDLVEVLDTPFGVRALIGDVQGKGMDAVRLAGRVLGSFREAAHEVADLAQVATAMDRAVSRSAGPEVFVTAAIVQVDAATGDLLVVSCGHPAPFVVEPGAAPARALDVAPSPPLGMLALGGSPAVTPAHLEHAQRLVLVTDGLLEARRPRLLSRSPSGPFVDAEGLVGSTLGTQAPPHAGLAELVRGARRWSRGRLRDDMAVLVLARTGSAEGDHLVPAGQSGATSHSLIGADDGGTNPSER